MLGAFVAGAALGGLIVQDSTPRLGRRYGVALSPESRMLLAEIPRFTHQHLAGPLLAAMACGLQNAVATQYSGGIVSTPPRRGRSTGLGGMTGPGRPGKAGGA